MSGTKPPTQWLAPVLVAPMILAALAVPVAARAAVPPVVARLQQVMATAHSYRQTMVLRSSGGPAGASSTRMDMVAVRHGKVLEEYIRMTQQRAKGAANIIEMVSGAKHTCFKLSSATPWNCSMGSMASIAGSTDVLSSSLLKHITITPLGSKEVLGQSCDGYTIVYRLSQGSTTNATLWIGSSSGLPVEELGSSSTTIPVAAGKSLTTKSGFTVTWSQWNDPSPDDSFRSGCLIPHWPVRDTFAPFGTVVPAMGHRLVQLRTNRGRCADTTLRSPPALRQLGSRISTL